MAASKPQDLPPPGGYAKILYKRIPAKVYFSGMQLFLGYAAMTIGAGYLYYLNYRQMERTTVENRAGKMAVLPLLMAERDREFLKQMRRNRDEEASLMKNVAGWKVGTFYGEPIFKTMPKNEFWWPDWYDFCAHADYNTYSRRADFHLWN